MAKNYLFLDTQVFHRFAFDFANKHLVQLTHMAEDGSLVLLMPEVTRREIESHIAEKAAEIFGALRDLRKLGKNLQKPPFNSIGKGGTVEAIQEELMGQFDGFCKLTNVEHLPAKGLNLGRVLDDYFGKKPPFGEGKKKSEFPDAFAAQILLKWCKKHSRKVVVVSADGDWGGVKHSSLEILDTVAKFLNRFPNPTIARRIREVLSGSSYLLGRIKEEFEETKFEDPEYGLEIEDVKAEDVELGEILVTEIDKESAQVEASADISFTAFAKGNLRRSWRWRPFHNLDDDESVHEQISGTKSCNVLIELILEPEEVAKEEDFDVDYNSISLDGLSTEIDLDRYFG